MIDTLAFRAPKMAKKYKSEKRAKKKKRKKIGRSGQSVFLLQKLMRASAYR